jgi:hypothetical protein
MARASGERRIGEAAQRAGDLFQRPPAGDVRDGDQQRYLAFCDAHRLHQERALPPSGDIPIEPVLDIGESSRGPLMQESPQQVRFPKTALGQKWAVAEKRCKQPVPGLIRRKFAHEGGKRWFVDLLRGLAPAFEAEPRLVGIAGRRQVRIGGGRQ